MLPEFALNSILAVVIVLFPGLVFRRFYYASQFAKQFTKGEWSERIVISLFWGVVAQLITLLCFSYFPWIDFFLEKGISNIDIKNFLTHLSQNRWYIVFFLTYIFFSVGVAALMGYLGYKIIRLSKLDVRSSIWRYSNHWHYHFSGEFSSWNSKRKLLFTQIDLTIKAEDNGSKSKIVQGILADYTVNSSTGDLEYIFLEKSRKYSDTSKKFETIDGVFVVDFKDVLDMNKTLVYLSNKNVLKNDWYSNLFTVFMPFGLVICFILPWRFAVQEVSFWRIIISYIPASVCYIALVALFLPKKGKSTRSKEIEIRISLLILAMLFFLITKWILGRGFWF
ncbi:hypothetical protein [Capnocytophaga canimorsus]|uniref:hypothetical protein n=1 Tax=Capnocytophaga canimorsus TaxID=28188 RepID=UPI0028EE0FBD|nr:hypothetical protein [Capnocytophaga canimorsus]MDT9499125.1 hypothetical protein [Capnocytophaga canimorsus]